MAFTKLCVIERLRSRSQMKLDVKLDFFGVYVQKKVLKSASELRTPYTTINVRRHKQMTLQVSKFAKTSTDHLRFSSF